jgi:undecaprenyl-diphosphatase
LLGVLGPDKQLGRWVIEHRVHSLDWLFEGLSRIGTLGLVWIAIALVLAAVWRRPGVLVSVAAGLYAADLAATLIKLAVPRHRPRVHQLVRGPKDHSFPSGHAATSFAAATLLSWYAPRLRIPLFVLAAGIAFSRVYVGVHWPLDVLGGALLGWAIATALRRLAASRLRGLRAPRRG